MQEIAVLIPKIVSIFALAFFYFWPAIPAGLALGLSPLAVILTTSLSYATGVAVVTLLGERVRASVMKRLGRKAEVKSDGFLRRVWDKYGMVGLGLLAPMTVGAQIGAAIGLALNGKPRNLFIALALGGLAWSIALTAAVTLGVLSVSAVR
ncbi:MAG: small multi-drug export protein [Anaerolineae bacterium]|nr:small multi-drug export protein [Anaerolineae bacterium]